MTADILTFPSVDVAKIGSPPTCIADLKGDAKALVISAETDGYRVALAPAVTNAEREVTQTFSELADARYFADRMKAAFPLLYQLIVDRLPQRRQTLDEIMVPVPAGWGGAE